MYQQKLQNSKSKENKDWGEKKKKEEKRIPMDCETTAKVVM